MKIKSLLEWFDQNDVAYTFIGDENDEPGKVC